MSNQSTVAKRYAEALYQLGIEKALLDQFRDEMLTVKEVFQQNNELYTFLTHPRIKKEDKKKVVGIPFQGLHKDIVNTLNLLVERQRVEAIPAIIDHFIHLVNDAKGIAEATVYSVRELSDKERSELEFSFAKRFNRTALKLQNVVDPTMIGGIKIRVGNTIYDGSIRGKLNRLERNIVSANK
ncbi:F0F1 ATP synthase subunit delta [Oceanobacillus kapialis]|uniref:ATP synthase subunit delta n=1 Tax=Oceanobacillus kapialis TaxID=481353 RepID=A0ABW5Q1I9_9BACI